MKAVIQRVTRASVEVEERIVGAIGPGLLVLLGVVKGDGEADCRFMVEKLRGLRIFADDAGKMNRSLVDVGGAVLLVSQFTLLGSTKSGRRPAEDAAPPGRQAMVRQVAAALNAQGTAVETGVFAAHMKVELVNEGPVTFLLIVEVRFRRALKGVYNGQSASDRVRGEMGSSILARHPLRQLFSALTERLHGTPRLARSQRHDLRRNLLVDFPYRPTVQVKPEGQQVVRWWISCSNPRSCLKPILTVNGPFITSVTYAVYGRAVSGISAPSQNRRPAYHKDFLVDYVKRERSYGIVAQIADQPAQDDRRCSQSCPTTLNSA
jgi:D-tyrosyl-tRNA(Tyr) deacylase